jgi:hypothetical protein
MATAHEFLRFVLPASGWHCALVFDGDKRRQKFFQTTDELADYLLRQDQRGGTAYHACAAFKTNKNRKHENALGAQAFWEDLDVGDHPKKYPTLTEAVRNVARFCTETSLPVPNVFVASGSGLHVYWVLKQILDPATWEKYARSLKLLSQQHNLKVDHVRTADISSILRTPGTHNRKRGEMEVACGPLGKPYELNQFRCVETSTTTTGTTHVRHQSTLTAAALNLHGNEPADAERIADQCAQIRRIRDDPGSCNEPTIYATVGVLEFSSGTQGRDWFDPEYAASVEQKFKQHRAAGVGPTTCAYFESLAPETCQGCPHKSKITSPIQLGRSVGKKNEQTSQIEKAQTSIQANQVVSRIEKVNGHTHPFAQSGPQQAIVVEGFENRTNGLYAVSENSKGHCHEVLVSPFPVALSAMSTHESEHERHSLELTHQVPGEAQRIVFSGRELFGSGASGELVERGIGILDPERFKQYIKLSMAELRKTQTIGTRFEAFGWKDNDTAFLWGNRLYRNGNYVTITGSPELSFRSQYLSPQPGGSVEKWSAAANLLFGGGMEDQSFGLLCGFAAPIMRFHTHEEGGAIASFVNEHTGTGKTTRLEAAASIWGRLKGVKLYDDDTHVAKGLKLGIVGNLPATYDELASRDPEIIRKFVLMFTNGQDRDRGRRDGTLVHNFAEWQTILLLASNKPIVDILSAPGEPAAQAYRILEFNTVLDKKADTRRGDELRRIMEANSGHAADVYLRTLTLPSTIAYIRESVPRVTDQINDRAGLLADHRFWVRMAASVVIAGVIVRELNLLEFSIQRITDWLIDQMKSRTSGTGNKRQDTDYIVEYFTENINNVLVVKHEWRPKTATPPLNQNPIRQLYVRIEQDNNKAFILETSLNNYLLKMGVHRSAWIKRLADQGVLLGSGRYVTLGAGTTMNFGQAKCYVIDMAHPAMSGVARTFIQEPIKRDPDASRLVY